MTLQDLLNKTYSKYDYNCFHFMIDCYMFFYGRDIKDLFLEAFVYGVKTRRKTTMFKRCDSKRAHIVLVWYPEGLHCGTIVDGKVLHICEDVGVKWQPIDEVIRFANKVKFYEYCENLG